jgi:hypothetical protein
LNLKITSFALIFGPVSASTKAYSYLGSMVLRRTWKLINILSLDVAAGAAVSSIFFARIFSVMLPPYLALSLGLTVWMIYTSDHLLDARSIRVPASTERHRFHQQHFNGLLIMMLVAVGVLFVQSFFIIRPLLINVILVVSLVLAYLLIQRRLTYAKEFVGACFYTAGILVAPWSLLPRAMTVSEIVLVSVFALTAFADLLLFSWFTLESDASDHLISFTTILGKSITGKAILGACVTAILLAAVAIQHSHSAGPAFVLILMNGMLMIILQFHKYFAINDRYRRAGDAVFFLPLIYLVLF